MANTLSDALAIYAVNWPTRNPNNLLLQKLTRLDRIVVALRRHPCASAIKIFGSAVNEPTSIPGDIDAFLDLREASYADTLERYTQMRRLLAIATDGGYHGNYGYFDPFVFHRGRLKTRSIHEDYLNVCWIFAQNAEAITLAGRAGIPLADFTRSFVAEFAPPSEVSSL